MIEFWKSGGADILTEDAASVEGDGWDGQMFMDSQSLGADPYALMGFWAAQTRSLLFSTGVTNPLTRHPAVTASAIATVQALSGGRAVLGIGRGDSALAYLGYAPATVARFERALEMLQTLLQGETAEFDDAELSGHGASLDSLTLGDRPESMRLGWLPADTRKVPLDVAASGPRVIDIASRIAERVTFSVGAAPERVEWAVRRSRDARPDSMAPASLGAQLVVVCHPRPHSEEAQDAALRMTLPLARFQVLQRASAAGPTLDADQKSYDAVSRGYAMTKHSDFTSEKLVDAAVDPEFVARFAVIGTPEQCTERLIALAGLGLERFVVFGPGFHDDGERATSLFAAEVIPAVRAWAATQA